MPDAFDYCAERIRVHLFEEPSFGAPTKTEARFSLWHKFAHASVGWQLTVGVRRGEEKDKTLVLTGKSRANGEGEFSVPLPAYTLAFCLSVRVCAELTRCCKSCSRCCEQRADQCLDVKRCCDGKAVPGATLPSECCLCKKQKIQQRFKGDIVCSPLLPL